MMESSGARIAVWVVAGVLALAAGVKLVGHRGGPEAVEPVRVEGGNAAGRGAGGGGRVYVHVAGKVRRPGLYRLPAGARLAAALQRAGGAARGADLAAVNLAARVEDGQQILVPMAGAAAAAPAAGASGSGTAGPAAGTKLSLGNATAEQLDTLDGIGPTLAKRIVEYRQAHGGFRSVDELREVDGIGAKRFEALRKGLRP
jgi:competence protein ComEA